MNKEYKCALCDKAIEGNKYFIAGWKLVKGIPNNLIVHPECYRVRELEEKYPNASVVQPTKKQTE